MRCCKFYMLYHLTPRAQCTLSGRVWQPEILKCLGGRVYYNIIQGCPVFSTVKKSATMEIEKYKFGHTANYDLRLGGISLTLTSVLQTINLRFAVTHLWAGKY